MVQWKKSKLGELSEKITKGSTPTTYGYKFLERGIPFVKVENMANGRIVKEAITQYISEDAHDFQKRSQLQKGDVLFSIAGTIGRVALVTDEDIPANTNQAVAIIRGITKYFIPSFLKMQLDSHVSLKVKAKARGGAMNNISLDDLKEMDVVVPPFDVQENIVQAVETQFTRLDAAIKSLKAIKNKIVVYREAILKEAFTTAFSTSVTFRNLRLDDLKGEGRHAIKRGPFGSAIKKSFFVPKGYKVYEQKNAIYNDFRLGDYYINEDKFKELAAFEVKPGDLIISCSGTIGKVAVAPDNIEKGIINQALLKITLNHKVILTKYFIYLFQSRYLQHEVNKKTRGSAMLNISSVKDLKQIDFPVAKLDEQRKIVEEIESRFSVVDKLEEVVDNSLKKAEKLCKSILKSAFEGKLVN